jgi:hypothetical protein
VRSNAESLPLSFGLADSFVRDDNTAQNATISLLRPQQKFIRNTVSPQVRYDMTPLTAATLAYTNTVVVDKDNDQGTTISHAVTSGLQHQFSPVLAGSANYTFTTSNETGVSTTSTGSGASGRDFHRLQTNVAYDFDRITSGILSAFTLFAQDETQGRSHGAMALLLAYDASCLAPSASSDRLVLLCTSVREIVNGSE